ncbi:MAG: heme exporter protein CcmB [Myxococcota bacterium]|jgi:heme exporter protein CcmB|nr:heme exporter protein CcmB [Myxococcota bacterium]
MSFLFTVATTLSKELKVEWRSKEIVLSSALFALLVVLLCAFTLDLPTLAGRPVSAGVLWLAVALSGMLALSRTYEREKGFDAFRALLMTPAPKSGVYLGKTLAVCLYLLTVELVLCLVLELFFHEPVLRALPRLLPVLVLGTVGYAAVGTLFSAMQLRTTLKDLLLGVILYPLASPVLISAAKASQIIIDGGSLVDAADPLKLLIVADVLFVVAGLWLFGPLLEE